MDAILSLLGLDFYRNKAANVAADVLDDVYIDGLMDNRGNIERILKQVDGKKLIPKQIDL